MDTLNILTEAPSDPENYAYVVNGDTHGWRLLTDADKAQQAIDAQYVHPAPVDPMTKLKNFLIENPDVARAIGE